MNNWNDNIKKIIDFIPHFEKMQKEMSEMQAKKPEFSLGDIKAMQDENKLLKERLKALESKKVTVDLSKIEGAVNEMRLEFEQKIDSARRTFSELCDQGYDRALEQATILAPKPYDDSTLKSEMVKITETIKSNTDKIKEIDSKPQLKTYCDKAIKSSIDKINAANSTLAAKHVKLEQELTAIKKAFGG